MCVFFSEGHVVIDVLFSFLFVCFLHERQHDERAATFALCTIRWFVQVVTGAEGLGNTQQQTHFICQHPHLLTPHTAQCMLR